MTTELSRYGTTAFLGLSWLLGGCAAPPPPPQPIELTVTVREAGVCCQAGNLVHCHDRTADIKAAYADPEELRNTVPGLGFSDFDRPRTAEHDRPRTGEHDRPRTGEHDRPRTGEHDRPRTGEHDRPRTVERDLARTVERDRGDTIWHDLLRCKFRNDRLRSALETCHQKRNLCLSDNRERAVCNEEYSECYIEAVQAGPFDTP